MTAHNYTNFPRIFSLSTAGIKYHGYRDYLFHPLRTDFVGESGYGKSMIGDILQLIFVGSGEFKSGTEVDVGKERKPQGMVLEQSNQSSLGYVFLNIEVASGKFIVIGMYIESNTNRTTPFIIQAGYDWNERSRLTPLTIPITHRAFLQNESLLPIEMVAKQFLQRDDGQNLAIEVFRKNLDKYHTILQNNDILPLDFSGDGQKLRDYVRILQSFARGKGFKFDSESIKSFLFGNKDLEDIFRGFNSESKSLRSVFEQYQSNKVEIKNIEIIGEKLKNLEIALQCWQRDYHAKLQAEAYIHFQELEMIESNISEISTKRDVLRYKLLLLNERDKYYLHMSQTDKLQSYQDNDKALRENSEYRKDLELKIEILKTKREQLEVEYNKAKNVKEQIERVEDLVERYGSSEKALREHFTSQQRLYKEKEQLEKLISYLQERSLLERFKESLWSTNVNEARVEFQERLAHLDSELELLRSLSMFTNVSDADSLAQWALNKVEALSVEQESLLIYLQKLPRHEGLRKKGERYLPNPDAVLAQPVIEGQDANGFWLNLGGIYEFIPINPLGLTLGNRVELRKYLKEKQIEFESRYQKLLAEKEDLRKMSEALEEFGYNQSYADIFVNRSPIESFEFDEKLFITQEEFDRALTMYNQRLDLLAKCANADYEYKTNQQEIEDCSSELGRVKEKMDSLRKSLDCKSLHTLSQLVIQSEVSLKEAAEALQNFVRPPSYNLDEFVAIVFSSEHNDLVRLQFELSKEIGSLEGRLGSLQEQLPDAKSLFREARTKYEMEFGTLFDSSATLADINVTDLAIAFETSNRNFRTKIDTFIIEHVSHSRHLLENTTNINYIARMALPRVFSANEENLSITNQIAKRLTLLNEKNRELDDSSSEIILRYFRDVWRSYEKYMTTINRLKQFFNGENARITGGYRVKIITKESKEYPLAWINDLRNNLTLAGLPLFSSQISDNTLHDVVIETFKRYTGSTKNPDIKKLLDPKSYFDIIFTLENERGQTHGSEGQAYTAVALLSIARLSLVENSQGKPRRGVRFMPIDEAEGIGSNYQTLHNLAVKYGYQVVSMSINSVAGSRAGEQTVYTLIANPDPNSGVNSDPFPVLGYYHDYAPMFFPQDEE